MGLENVAGPTVQQACATNARALQMATQEIEAGTASCSLVITTDRMSNAPIVYYPDPTGQLWLFADLGTPAGSDRTAQHH